MTTDTDKIEELAKWLGSLRCWQGSNKSYAVHKEYAAFLRSLSAKLTELRQAKESLDWLLEYAPFTMRDAISSACANSKRLPPPYLKSRLEGKK